MTDQAPRILFRRTDVPGIHYGVPDRDLTEDDYRAVPPDLQRDIDASPLFVRVDLEKEAAELRTRLDTELAGKTRPDLDQIAAGLGVEDPGALQNKEAVIDAIAALGVAELGGN